MDAQTETFRQWGVVELMGHRRLAGLLSEQVIAGAPLLRVDVPAPDGSMTTQFYGASAIYCLTPTSEEAARAVAARTQPEPIYHYELPQLAAAQRDGPDVLRSPYYDRHIGVYEDEDDEDDEDEPDPEDHISQEDAAYMQGLLEVEDPALAALLAGDAEEEARTLAEALADG